MRASLPQAASAECSRRRHSASRCRSSAVTGARFARLCAFRQATPLRRRTAPPHAAACRRSNFTLQQYEPRRHSAAADARPSSRCPPAEYGGYRNFRGNVRRRVNTFTQARERVAHALLRLRLRLSSAARTRFGGAPPALSAPKNNHKICK